MPDERAAFLLRRFAESHQPLPDPEFVARVTGALRPRASLTGVAETLISAVEATLRGLAAGVTTPLRLRYAGIVALSATLVAVWSLIPAL